ncbi:cache domain-containing protein [Nitrosopumilus sp. Nsub]|uniref:methyl-accepting chemotaxis protein n=1 Tax=Nitrosopumilus sp. Nsub TaxID=1776294 RepID=UPI00082FF53A|nr:cache domain-containing protein [Nitrosopumilus sp. Nsub]
MSQKQTVKTNSDVEKDSTFTLNKMADIGSDLEKNVQSAIKEIDLFNSQAKLISINARIEASRVGEAGRAFSIVAEQMNDLTNKIGEVNEKMKAQSQTSIKGIHELIKKQAVDMRGNRLVDLSVTNMDLIDRNLYERSCDVRWWATENALITALESKSKKDSIYASQRLYQILESYTVYVDLVLADTEGKIITNGKSHTYDISNSNVSSTEWFRTAMSSKQGQFGMQSVGRCPLVNNQIVSIFSCPVRSKKDGKVLGVLGIIFNWDHFAHQIIEETPIEKSEKQNTRICITDESGDIFGDSQGECLIKKLDASFLTGLKNNTSGFTMINNDNQTTCVAKAHSKGYETYNSGWSCFIIQKV